nr:MAG TPA: Oligo alginate lyase [Caudoviricetes sp.]
MGTLTLYANDSAIVRTDNPNTNYYSATQTTSDDFGNYCRMLMTFAPTSAQLAALRYKKITAITYNLFCSQINSGGTTNDPEIYLLTGKPQLRSVTYNTMPGASLKLATIPKPYSLENNKYRSTATTISAANLKMLLENGACVYPNMNVVVQSAKGSNKPYIVITYEDQTAIPKIYLTESRKRASEIAQEFKWSLQWDSYYTYELPTVASQTLKWRVKNASTANSVSVGADETSATLPAGTLQVGSLEWTIQLTTSQGGTVTAAWSSFTVEKPIISAMSPAAGAYTPKHVASIFSWDVQQQDKTMVSVEQTRATIYWRTTGTTTTHSIAVSGSKKSYTVPAETFSAESIDWMITAITAGNLTATSAWVTVSTTEATPSCKPVAPSGIVIDATIVNRFSWKHIISTGTPQSKADLQWSADGTTWNTLATVTGENQYYDVPANKFTSGTKYWRVRTYNTDGTASAWSEKAEFIAINAPSAPSIVIQSTGPRPRITWQTTEQEAYQLTLSNGYASGTVYGTNKTWRSPLYLADGNYTVRVRVQNKYGMWSEWGAAALPVSHTEGEAITLGVSANHEAALAWQTAGSYDFYIVERDGIAIARTTEKAYVDHTSIGDVRYQVRGCYADSDSYGLSNAAAVTILPGTAMVCALDSGAWLRLPLSETMLRTSRVSRTAAIQTVHLSGLDYPVAERTEFRDLSLEISCAFLRKDRASALALEAMLGRIVCAKTKHGDMSVGYITSLEKNADEIMARYSFEVTNIYRREEISLDP